MDEDKEILEKELEFLKESFESDVISEEEFNTSKENIDKKLNELKTKEKTIVDTKAEDKKIVVEELTEVKEIDNIKKDQEPKEIVIEEKKEPESKKEAEETKEKIESESKREEKTEEKKETDVAESKEAEKSESVIEEPKKEEVEQEEVKVYDEKKRGKWKYLFLGLFVIFLLFYAYSYFNSGETEDIKENNVQGVVPVVIACSSDEGCVEEGKKGTCVNPGTIDSECEFKDIVKTKLTIVNTKECFNCGSARVLKFLEELFQGLYLETLDFESEEGEELVKNLGSEVLPLFVFDENLGNTFNFDKIKRTFNLVDGNYVMNREASGANYFINREIIPLRLDVFLIDGEVSTSKAQANLQEFLDLFEDEIEFNIHGENDFLTQDLEIKTFPTFLINNKIKFSGVQPADKIRENFCQMNELEECDEELTKSLV